MFRQKIGNFKPHYGLFNIFIFFSLLSACSSAPKSIQDKVSVGMDKDQVLELMGNPGHSKRISGYDRWTYDVYTSGVKTTTHIYFQGNQVQYFGSDAAFEKSLLDTAANKKSSDSNSDSKAGFKSVD